MAGEKLHNYDLQLCDYVLGNINQYLGEKRFARAARQVLSPPILKYLVDDLDPEIDQERLLLSDREFDSLESTFEGDVPELNKEWFANEHLHDRRVQCVREVRDELTRQDAEDWSRACARFAERLKGKHVRLGEGIEIVHEWVWHIRRLLRAMGAIDLLPYPEGRSPTPTNPTPPLAPSSAAAPTPETETVDREAETLARALAKMRELIAKFGMNSPPKKLLEVCGIQDRLARDTLRILQELGEYSGYGRKRPIRYSDIRSRYGSVLRLLGISLPDRA